MKNTIYNEKDINLCAALDYISDKDPEFSSEAICILGGKSDVIVLATLYFSKFKSDDFIMNVSYSRAQELGWLDPVSTFGKHIHANDSSIILGYAIIIYFIYSIKPIIKLNNVDDFDKATTGDDNYNFFKRHVIRQSYNNNNEVFEKTYITDARIIHNYIMSLIKKYDKDYLEYINKNEIVFGKFYSDSRSRYKNNSSLFTARAGEIQQYLNIDVTHIVYNFGHSIDGKLSEYPIIMELYRIIEFSEKEMYTESFIKRFTGSAGTRYTLCAFDLYITFLAPFILRNELSNAKELPEYDKDNIYCNHLKHMKSIYN